jgi:acyl-CoA carboxylase epsilon subunit
VAGRPSAEDIAAVSAILSAVAADGGADEPVRQVGGWSDLSRRLRRPLSAGPGAWRNSSWQ